MSQLRYRAASTPTIQNSPVLQAERANLHGTPLPYCPRPLQAASTTQSRCCAGGRGCVGCTYAAWLASPSALMVHA